MPIVRTKINEFKRARCWDGVYHRNVDDYDLAFKDWRIYILAEHEIFSISPNNNYIGPSLITRHDDGVDTTHNEYYVNDAIQWAWIRRCIKKLHFSPETMPDDDVADDEKNIVEVFDSPPTKKGGAV